MSKIILSERAYQAKNFAPYKPSTLSGKISEIHQYDSCARARRLFVVVSNIESRQEGVLSFSEKRTSEILEAFNVPSVASLVGRETTLHCEEDRQFDRGHGELLCYGISPVQPQATYSQ